MRKPEGLWFGDDDARCFGMLHKPNAPSTRGVVFCNAFGYEGLLSYRAYRHIADGVAARGHWALRFDYDGEGDSAGGAWDPRRVDAWMASIDERGERVARPRCHRHTARRLPHRRNAGVPVRDDAPGSLGSGDVGALRPRRGLRTRATCPRADVGRARGRSSRMSRNGSRADSLEAVGFELSGETLRDIAGIDLLADAQPHCPPAVLRDRPRRRAAQ